MCVVTVVALESSIALARYRTQMLQVYDLRWERFFKLVIVVVCVRSCVCLFDVFVLCSRSLGRLFDCSFCC